MSLYSIYIVANTSYSPKVVVNNSGGNIDDNLWREFHYSGWNSPPPLGNKVNGHHEKLKLLSKMFKMHLFCYTTLTPT